MPGPSELHQGPTEPPPGRAAHPGDGAVIDPGSTGTQAGLSPEGGRSRLLALHSAAKGQDKAQGARGRVTVHCWPPLNLSCALCVNLCFFSRGPRHLLKYSGQGEPFTHLWLAPPCPILCFCTDVFCRRSQCFVWPHRPGILHALHTVALAHGAATRPAVDGVSESRPPLDQPVHGVNPRGRPAHAQKSHSRAAHGPARARERKGARLTPSQPPKRTRDQYSRADRWDRAGAGSAVESLLFGAGTRSRPAVLPRGGHRRTATTRHCARELFTE
jgi:hypothetical protein